MAAISSIQKLIKEFEDLKRQKKSLQSAARHANCIGKEFIKIGKFNEAVKYHEEEVQLSQRCNDVLGAGIAERCIVDAYIEMGFHDKAEKHCILYQKYVDDAKSVDELQRVFHTFGRLYLTMAEAQADDVNEKSKLLEKADSFFRNALRQCDLLDEHTADLSQRRANALSNLALVLRSQGLPLQAMEHIKKGIKEAKKMCDGRDKQGTLCYCYADASDILFYMNTTAKTDCPELLEEAVEYVKLAIPLAEQLKDFSRLLDFHNQMAEMFTVLLKFEEAMRHLKSAWKLCSKQKRYFVLAQKANLAQANNDAESPGDIAIAVKRYKKLRLFVQKSKDLKDVAYEETAVAAKRYEAMGDLSSDHKYFRLACRCYKSMAEIARQLNDSTSEAAAYVSLAGTSEDLELYDAAIYWYEKELCLNKESLLEEAKSYYNIAVCQKRLNRGSITVVESFKKAANLADNCGDEKLKINTYREWYEYLVQVNATDSIVFHEYPFLNDPAVQDADEDSRRSDNDCSYVGADVQPRKVEGAEETIVTA